MNRDFLKRFILPAGLGTLAVAVASLGGKTGTVVGVAVGLVLLSASYLLVRTTKRRNELKSKVGLVENSQPGRDAGTQGRAPRVRPGEHSTSQN